MDRTDACARRHRDHPPPSHTGILVMHRSEPNMEPQESHHTRHGVGNDVASCIATCQECAQVCSHTLYGHCLQVGGAHVQAEHVLLMTDCIMICRLAADFMIRGSSRHVETCRLCAEVCQSCASDCEAMTGMDDCVQACRACSAACRTMSTMVV
jgi:hypothetical protein